MHNEHYGKQQLVRLLGVTIAASVCRPAVSAASTGRTVRLLFLKVMNELYWHTMCDSGVTLQVM
jgi:hypothetical protein